jgi:hypothetical protein
VLFDFTMLDHCVLSIVSEDVLRRLHLLLRDPVVHIVARCSFKDELESFQNPNVILTHHGVLALGSDAILLPRCSCFAGSL